MMHSKLGRRLARPFRDFTMGLAVFLAVALSGVVDTSQPGSLIATSAYAQLFEEEPVAQRPTGTSAPAATASTEASAGSILLVLNPQYAQQQAMALASLALAFATLVAVNLWFARHLRRVHASHRRNAAASQRQRSR